MLSFPLPHSDEGGFREGAPQVPFQLRRGRIVQTVGAAGFGVWGTSVGSGDPGETTHGLDFAGKGGT